MVPSQADDHAVLASSVGKWRMSTREARNLMGPMGEAVDYSFSRMARCRQEGHRSIVPVNVTY